MTFQTSGVTFDYYERLAAWKVWWPGIVGAGRMREEFVRGEEGTPARSVGWYGCDVDPIRYFSGVSSRSEAVRRMVAREWNHLDLD